MTKELDEVLTPLPEARASVTYNLTSKDGYGLLLTIRSGNEAEIFEIMVDTEEYIKKQGYTPEVRRSFGGGNAKPKDYVEGEKCPKCGSPLVKVTYKDKKTGEDKTLIKCSTQKYDFMTKTSSGCDYTDFGENQIAIPASPSQRKALEGLGLWKEGMSYSEARELLTN